MCLPAALLAGALREESSAATLAATGLIAAWLLVAAPAITERWCTRGTLLLAVFFTATGLVLTVDLSMALLFLLGGALLLPLGGKSATTTQSTRIPAPNVPVADKPDDTLEHRLRGIKLQASGNLDGALAAFRRCSTDKATAGLLYKLAQEFEQARRYDRVVVALRTIAKTMPGYLDIDQRLRRAELMIESAAASQAIAEAEGRLTLGRYEVQDILGKGAMGIVYQGYDPTIGRVVAIKTIQLDSNLNPDPDELDALKQRFFREAETVGKLTHPHIVTIYDAGEAGGLAWIAMEMLRGQDLEKHTRTDELLPVTIVIETIAQTADGLDYAHSRGVIHRDIKPANLVYDRAVRAVKITDFGIARILGESKTQMGRVLGTPSYMSPEQLTGRTLDGRSDIFSLGVTLYQLLTGQLPFRADNLQKLVQAVSGEDPPPVTALRADLPEEIDAVVARAMHKDPDSRFQRGSDFARALRALYTDEGDLWV